MLAMAEENWDLFLDLENANLPAEIRSGVVAAFKTGTTQQDYVRMVRAFSSSTITDLLGQIEAPILVLHSLDQHWLSVDEGMRLGTQLAARVVLLNGPLEPDAPQGVQAIVEFLESIPSERPATTEHGPSRTPRSAAEPHETPAAGPAIACDR